MGLKLFGQIVLLMIIGALILILMKCAIRQCPTMGKYMKYSRPCPTCPAPK